MTLDEVTQKICKWNGDEFRLPRVKTEEDRRKRGVKTRINHD